MESFSDCIFCQIVKKQIPAKIVLENDHVVVFHDINKVADVHLIIIPKAHLKSVNDLENVHENITTEMMLAAKKAAHISNVHQSGYRLVINTGANAGQTVFHLHMHLLGGRSLSWPPG